MASNCRTPARSTSRNWTADLKKNGQSIEVGKVVTVTDIAFDDNKIELELDGGGKNKKEFLRSSRSRPGQPDNAGKQ